MLFVIQTKAWNIPIYKMGWCGCMHVVNTFLKVYWRRKIHYYKSCCSFLSKRRSWLWAFIYFLFFTHKCTDIYRFSSGIKSYKSLSYIFSSHLWVYLCQGCKPWPNFMILPHLSGSGWRTVERDHHIAM